MVRTVALALLTLVLSASFEPQRARKARAKRNHVPIIQSFSSSSSRIESCPFSPGGVCGPFGSRITLQVEASDPDNDELTYKYSVSSGEIEGVGQLVTWNVDPKRSGVQTAKVEVADTKGSKASSAVSVELVPCGSCDPPCPALNVRCPATVVEGATVLFEAVIADSDFTNEPVFLWHVSSGRIAGQVGPVLRIKANGSPGEVITATVRVKGIDPTCSSEASCASEIVKRAK
jgi:hypothetical protein